MNQKTDRFVEEMRRAAAAAGVEHIHFHIETIRKQACEVEEHQIASTLIADETLIAVEGCFEGQQGTVFTESPDPAQIPQLIELLRQTARVNGLPFAPKDLCAPAPEQSEACLTQVLQEADGLLQAEAAMYSAHDAVVHTSLGLTSVHRTVTLANEKGERISDSMAAVSMSASAMAKSGDAVQTAYLDSACPALPDYKAEGCRAAMESGAMLGAGPCPAGNYRAVIRGDVFAQLLDAYLPNFYGENVQRGLSLLAGKEGTTIASPAVTLSENPVGIIRRTFDDEGAPTTEKQLIHSGVLSALLYNQASAKTAGLPTTGNGFRPSYRADISTAATNITLHSGEQDLEGLLGTMGKGLLIVNCDGIFAGANPVSGDFSLISKGWYVEDGERKYPVNQITIGGNFYTLLNSIAAVGGDCHTHLSTAITSVTAPSVLVESLAVSS